MKLIPQSLIGLSALGVTLARETTWSEFNYQVTTNPNYVDSIDNMPELCKICFEGARYDKTSGLQSWLKNTYVRKHGKNKPANPMDDTIGFDGTNCLFMVFCKGADADDVNVTWDSGNQKVAVRRCMSSGSTHYWLNQPGQGMKSCDHDQSWYRRKQRRYWYLKGAEDKVDPDQKNEFMMFRKLKQQIWVFKQDQNLPSNAPLRKKKWFQRVLKQAKKLDRQGQLGFGSL